MLLKIFLYKLFFFMFISFFYCKYSFVLSSQNSNKTVLIKNKDYWNIDLYEKSKEKLFFLKKNECFSFLQSKKKKKI